MCLAGTEQRERDIAERLRVHFAQAALEQRGQLGRISRCVQLGLDARLFQQRPRNRCACFLVDVRVFTGRQPAQVVAVEIGPERIDGSHLAVGGEGLFLIIFQIMRYLCERVGVRSGGAGDISAFLRLFGACGQGADEQRRCKQQREKAFDRHVSSVLSVCRCMRYLYCKDGAGKCQERKC